MGKRERERESSHDDGGEMRDLDGSCKTNINEYTRKATIQYNTIQFVHSSGPETVNVFKRLKS